MPILNGWAGFILAGELNAGAEERRAAFALETAAELLGHALEAAGGDGGQIALGEFGVEPVQLF